MLRIGGPEPAILKTQCPDLPQFVFEFHRQTGKVWIVQIPGRFEDRVFIPASSGSAKATVLAEHCDTHGRFVGFVQTYLRGYRQGMQDEQRLADGEPVTLGYTGGGPEVHHAGKTGVIYG